jgi:hypothetical protein
LSVRLTGGGGSDAGVTLFWTSSAVPWVCMVSSRRPDAPAFSV